MFTYLLLSSDVYDVNDAIASAYNVASERLKRKVWPLYPRTSFAKFIQPGDLCMIYIAGKKKFSRMIVATATVADVKEARRSDWFELEELLVDSPNRIIFFDQVTYVSVPVPLRELLSKLELTKFSANNWGAYMQGGCKRLSRHDVNVIQGAFGAS